MRIEQKTLTILVAEDNGSNFKLIESILGKDYHLLHAWNGKEAIEFIPGIRTAVDFDGYQYAGDGRL